MTQHNFHIKAMLPQQLFQSQSFSCIGLFYMCRIRIATVLLNPIFFHNFHPNFNFFSLTAGNAKYYLVHNL